MNKYSPRESVELFHLIILDLLGRKIDKRHYALKGGCNLRFFMRSFRYSEDMDLDVTIIPKDKLQDVMERILKSRTLEQLLDVNGIRIAASSAPKQTDTTQRWKFSLSVASTELPLPTKIEFSRRGIREGVVFGPINPDVIRTYSLSPIMANHYDPDSAYVQKIEALATRRAVQARDVFDLYLLRTSGVSGKVSDAKARQHIGTAKANAMSVSFDMFRGQVWSWLHPDYQAQYDSAELWDDMVLNVVGALEGAQT